MFATPKRPSAPASTPLMEFSPNLSPISMMDASIPFNVDQTPDRPYRATTPPSSHYRHAMKPFLPGIAEEVDANASFADPSAKPTNLDNTLLHSVSLLNSTPQRPSSTPPIRGRATSHGQAQDAEQASAFPKPHLPDDAPSQPAHDERDTGYSRSANRALLQSVAESHRRWRNDSVENLLRSSANRRASPPDLPHDAAKTPAAPTSATPVLITPTPVRVELSGAAAQPPASPITAPNLPVGSLYALVLDNTSNPVLVPIRSSSPQTASRQHARQSHLEASSPFGLGSETRPAAASSVFSQMKASLGSDPLPSHYASYPPASSSSPPPPPPPPPVVSSALASTGTARTFSPSSSSQRVATAGESLQQGFLRHSAQHRSFAHLEAQVIRELRDSRERLEARPVEIAQDAEFHAAYQNFYTPRKGSTGTPSSVRPLPEWARLLQPEKRLRASVPQYTSPSHAPGTARSQLERSQLWETADVDPSPRHRQESLQYQFWKERIAQRNATFALHAATP